MPTTETGDNNTTIAVVGAVIGAAVTGIPAIGVWILNLLKTRRDTEKQQRADALSEWQQIVGVLQKDLEEMKTELNSCRAQHTEAQKRLGELTGELLVLKTLLNKKPRTEVRLPQQKPNNPNDTPL